MSAREEVLRIGPSRALVGVATRPEAHTGKGTGVVLLNAGLVHHVGPARLWVQAARRLADRGFPALRLDFSGIGDSPDSESTLRFESRAPKEARAAMDALGELTGAARFVLIGLCSGAEIAFKTALEDSRVSAVVLVNAPRFLEEPDAGLVARLERRQAARYYWSVALRNPRSWLKILRGRAELGSVARALWTRIARSGALREPSQESPDARAFRELRGRGVALHLVLSEGDWAEDYLAAILGPSALRGDSGLGLVVASVPAADHLLTPLRAQRTLLDTLDRWSANWG